MLLRHFGFLAAFMLVFTMVSNAYAEPKPWIWSWYPSHWTNLDFEPYLEDAKHPHNSQWEDSKWKSEHWAQQRESGKHVIEGFYRADIIREQYVDDDIPVLVVGPSFYLLGGQDKRRVAEMVDSVYHITDTRKNGMYMLYDWKTEEAIGSYTKYGLQIQ